MGDADQECGDYGAVRICHHTKSSNALSRSVSPTRQLRYEIGKERSDWRDRGRNSPTVSKHALSSKP